MNIFLQRVSDSFHGVIPSFVDDISSHFNLPREDVLSFCKQWWDPNRDTTGLARILLDSTPRASEASVQTRPVATTTTQPTIVRKAIGANKEEKPDKCKYILKTKKECGAACKGDFCGRHSKKEGAEEKKEASSTSKKSSNASRSKKKEETLPEGVQKHISETVKRERTKLLLERNNFGNIVHVGTQMVYDQSTRRFFGKQSPDGSVIALTANDIEQCKEWKVSYVLPENLSTYLSVTGPELEELDPAEENDDYEDIDE